MLLLENTLRRPLVSGFLSTLELKDVKVFYEDLSPCNDYFGVSGTRLVTIGWIDGESRFTTGSLSPLVFDTLVEMFANLRKPALFLGEHYAGSRRIIQ